jgi:Tfp pilus assembly protein PilV
MKAVETCGEFTLPAFAMSSADRRSRISSRPARSRQSGLTLVEVMVSGGILAITLLGILGALFYAYNTAAAVRYHDNARFILKSVSDQFMVMPAQTTTGAWNPLWTNTGTTATGVGMSWQDFNGTAVVTSTGTATGLSVTLGGTSGNPLIATVTRKVNYLDSSGHVVSTITPTSAGYLLQGDFTITYTFKGQVLSQTQSLVRTP